METRTSVTRPNLFMPHRNLSDQVNRNIVQSEIEGGVYLDDLPQGATIDVETRLDHGTTFIVRLDAIRAIPDEVEQAAAASPELAEPARVAPRALHTP